MGNREWAGSLLFIAVVHRYWRYVIFSQNDSFAVREKWVRARFGLNVRAREMCLRGPFGLNVRARELEMCLRGPFGLNVRADGL